MSSTELSDARAGEGECRDHGPVGLPDGTCPACRVRVEVERGRASQAELLRDRRSFRASASSRSILRCRRLGQGWPGRCRSRSSSIAASRSEMNSSTSTIPRGRRGPVGSRVRRPRARFRSDEKADVLGLIEDGGEACGASCSMGTCSTRVRICCHWSAYLEVAEPHSSRGSDVRVFGGDRTAVLLDLLGDAL